MTFAVSRIIILFLINIYIIRYHLYDINKPECCLGSLSIFAFTIRLGEVYEKVG